MTPTDRQMFLLHSKTAQFQRQQERARHLIDAALQTSTAWYVAVSGGKDSTVVLDLIRQRRPTIPAVFSDDEWWLPETETYLRQIQHDGVNLRWIRTTARHTEWFATTGEFPSIPAYAREQGWTGCFLGLRKDENAYRRVGINSRGLLFYSQATAAWNCTPIADWTTRDVWAYICSTGITYNQAYDRLTDMGIPAHRQRIGPFAVDRALGYGQLAILKRGWPSLFNRYVARYPEASSYV